MSLNPMHSDPLDVDVDIEVAAPLRAQIDPETLREVVKATLRHASVSRGLVTLVISDDETVQRLNRDYRDVDEPTDVLSFPAREGEETLIADLPPDLQAEMGVYWGDVIIAYPYAARQAEAYGNSVAAELRMLAVHGTLHLLGYDHDTPENEEEMWTAQRRILTQFGDADLADRPATDA